MAILTRFRLVLGYLLTIAFVVVGARYLSGLEERVQQLVSRAYVWCPALGLVVFSSLAVQACFLKQLASELGAEITRRECFYLVGSTNLLEVVTLPAAGVAYRGFYLQSVWGVPLASYSAGLAVLALVRVVVWGVAGVGGLIWISSGGEAARRGIVGFLLAGLIMLIAAGISQRLLCRMAGNGTGHVRGFAERCLRVTSSRRIRLTAVAAMLGCALIQVMAFFAIFHASQLPVDLLETAAITAFHQLSGVLGFTPGALGVQETASLAPSAMFGVGVEQMLPVLAMMRVGRVLLAIALGGPCWWLLAIPESGHAPRPTILDCGRTASE